MRFRCQPRDALSLRFCFTGISLVFGFVMLVHFFLMLVKIKFIHLRRISNFESFDVTCLTFHTSSPVRDAEFLRLLNWFGAGLWCVQLVIVNVGSEMFVIAPLDQLVHVATAKQQNLD